MRKGNFFRAAAIVAAIALPGLSQAQLLNGSFEAPVTSPKDDIAAPATIGAWSVIGNNVSLINNAWLPPSQTASNGLQWVDLTGQNEGFGKGVSQEFASSHDNFFLVEFDLGRLGNRGSASLTLTFNGQAQTFTNSLAGSDASMLWKPESFHFMASPSGTNTISFVGLDSGFDPITNGVSSSNNTIGLDNVRVTAVPEPTAVAMMLASLGALAFVARRRKS